MEIEFDQDKRDKTLQEPGLDFARAGEVFASVTVAIEDIRRDYGETRYISVGLLDLRVVILVWTPRGKSRRIKSRRIISMRYANDREKEKYSKHLDCSRRRPGADRRGLCPRRMGDRRKSRFS
ncbi:BrnT family toxin [Desulfocastanea catecholica]